MVSYQEISKIIKEPDSDHYILYTRLYQEGKDTPQPICKSSKTINNSCNKYNELSKENIKDLFSPVKIIQNPNLQLWFRNEKITYEKLQEDSETTTRTILLASREVSELLYKFKYKIADNILFLDYYKHYIEELDRLWGHQLGQERISNWYSSIDLTNKFNFLNSKKIRQFNFSDNLVLTDKIQLNASTDLQIGLNKDHFGYDIGYLSSNPKYHRPVKIKSSADDKDEFNQKYMAINNDMFSNNDNTNEDYLQYWYPLYEGLGQDNSLHYNWYKSDSFKNLLKILNYFINNEDIIIVFNCNAGEHRSASALIWYLTFIMAKGKIQIPNDGNIIGLPSAFDFITPINIKIRNSPQENIYINNNLFQIIFSNIHKYILKYRPIKTNYLISLESNMISDILPASKNAKERIQIIQRFVTTKDNNYDILNTLFTNKNIKTATDIIINNSNVVGEGETDVLISKYLYEIDITFSKFLIIVYKGFCRNNFMTAAFRCPFNYMDSFSKHPGVYDIVENYNKNFIPLDIELTDIKIEPDIKSIFLELIIKKIIEINNNLILLDNDLIPEDSKSSYNSEVDKIITDILNYIREVSNDIIIHYINIIIQKIIYKKYFNLDNNGNDSGEDILIMLIGEHINNYLKDDINNDTLKQTFNIQAILDRYILITGGKSVKLNNRSLNTLKYQYLIAYPYFIKTWDEHLKGRLGIVTPDIDSYLFKTTYNNITFENLNLKNFLKLLLTESKKEIEIREALTDITDLNKYYYDDGKLNETFYSLSQIIKARLEADDDKEIQIAVIRLIAQTLDKDRVEFIFDNDTFIETCGLVFSIIQEAYQHTKFYRILAKWWNTDINDDLYDHIKIIFKLNEKIKKNGDYFEELMKLCIDEDKAIKALFQKIDDQLSAKYDTSSDINKYYIFDFDDTLVTVMTIPTSLIDEINKFIETDNTIDISYTFSKHTIIGGKILNGITISGNNVMARTIFNTLQDITDVTDTFESSLAEFKERQIKIKLLSLELIKLCNQGLEFNIILKPFHIETKIGSISQLFLYPQEIIKPLQDLLVNEKEIVIVSSGQHESVCNKFFSILNIKLLQQNMFFGKDKKYESIITYINHEIRDIYFTDDRNYHVNNLATNVNKILNVADIFNEHTYTHPGNNTTVIHNYQPGIIFELNKSFNDYLLSISLEQQKTLKTDIYNEIFNTLGSFRFKFSSFCLNKENITRYTRSFYKP